MKIISIVQRRGNRPRIIRIKRVYADQLSDNPLNPWSLAAPQIHYKISITVGVPLAGQFLQLFPMCNFGYSLPRMMGVGLLVNFAVYAAIVYAGLSLQQAKLKMPHLRMN